MARAIRKSSIDPKMFRHFAAATLVVTLLPALFTQDDANPSRPRTIGDRPAASLTKLGDGGAKPLFKSMPTATSGWGNDLGSYGSPMNSMSGSGVLPPETLIAAHDPASPGDDPDFIPTEEELLMLGLALDQFRALAADQRIAIIRKLTRSRQRSLMAASIARSGNHAAYRDLML